MYCAHDIQRGISSNLLYIPPNNIKGCVTIEPIAEAFRTYLKRDPMKNPKLLPEIPIKTMARTK